MTDMDKQWTEAVRMYRERFVPKKQAAPEPPRTWRYEVYRPNVDGYSESTFVEYDEEKNAATAIQDAEEQGGWEECDWDDMNESQDYRVEVTDGSGLWLVV